MFNQEKFNAAKQALQTGVKYTIITGVIIPALGLLAHMGGSMSAALEMDANFDIQYTDYSLKNRFECAYSFNTPDEHKTYYGETGKTETVSGTILPVYGRTPYMASPYATYGTMAAAGLLGCIIGYNRRRK